MMFWLLLETLQIVRSVVAESFTRCLVHREHPLVQNLVFVTILTKFQDAKLM